jgi:ribosomal protein L11 methyltransferase
MVLTAMCEHARTHPKPDTMKIFDLGTGSGILAIAASLLFDAPVLGNDIDLGAIQNATDNIQLNKVDHLVTVCSTPLHQITGSFDLIVANLYGEVLTTLAPEVTRIARPGATAILSGITEIVWDHVWKVYESLHGWRLISEQCENGWMCVVIQKVEGPT